LCRTDFKPDYPAEAGYSHLLTEAFDPVRW
jgi:hypothetical protein